MHIFRTILSTVLVAMMALPVEAQSEGGLIAGAEAEKKLTNKLSVNVEAELRTRNNFKTMDRWNLGLGVEYKFTKWLKANAGYQLLHYNNREKTEYYTTYESDGTTVKNHKVHWRPSYWGAKHRFYVSLTSTYKFANNIRVSLRERWQYSYRPSKATERWTWRTNADGTTADDYALRLDDDYVRSASGKNQLRSRFQIEYDKKRALLTPYASVELFNSWKVEKVRYTVGTDIRLSKQHSLGVYYRFQKMHNVEADDYDPDMHYLGVGYKFKF